jgi:hypothetical protein
MMSVARDKKRVSTGKKVISQQEADAAADLTFQCLNEFYSKRKQNSLGNGPLPCPVCYAAGVTVRHYLKQCPNLKNCWRCNGVTCNSTNCAVKRFFDGICNNCHMSLKSKTKNITSHPPADKSGERYQYGGKACASGGKDFPYLYGCGLYDYKPERLRNILWSFKSFKELYPVEVMSGDVPSYNPDRELFKQWLGETWAEQQSGGIMTNAAVLVAASTTFFSRTDSTKPFDQFKLTWNTMCKMV